jgi:sarcosine oxidase subunit beta
MGLTAGRGHHGGGVTGASTAFRLTRRGVRDVLVVDKGSLASGGTGKSSACVRQHYSTAETCRMIRYSLEFFQHFAERVDGESCGFRHTGYLLGVDDKMRVPMAASVALQRSVGINTRLVSPVEIRELEPRVRADDFVAVPAGSSRGPASENGKLRHVGGAHGRGDRRRKGLMLLTLPMPGQRANLGDRHVSLAEDDRLAGGHLGEVPGKMSLGRMNIDLDHDCIAD